MSIEAMRMALAGIRWHCFGECRTEGWDDGPPRLGDVAVVLENAIKEAEKNDFNPDWNQMETLLEENKRLAKQLADIKDWEAVAADQAMTIAMFKDDLEEALKAKREWVGLAYDDYENKQHWGKEFVIGAEWAEAKLKEKNHVD